MNLSRTRRQYTESVQKVEVHLLATRNLDFGRGRRWRVRLRVRPAAAAACRARRGGRGVCGRPCAPLRSSSVTRWRAASESSNGRGHPPVSYIHSTLHTPSRAPQLTHSHLCPSTHGRALLTEIETRTVPEGRSGASMHPTPPPCPIHPSSLPSPCTLRVKMRSQCRGKRLSWVFASTVVCSCLPARL